MLPPLSRSQIGDRAVSTLKVAAGLGGVEEALVSVAKMQKARLIVLREDQKRAAAWLTENTRGSKTLWCQFNPTSLAVSKKVSWNPAGDETLDTGKWEIEEQIFSGKEKAVVKKYKKDVKSIGNRNTPGIKFGGGQPASFGLDLFFDTSLVVDESERDVRRYTNDLLALTLGEAETDAQKKGQVKDPPKVLFVWGKLVLFEAVVTDVEVTYLLFDVDGTPVRAKAKVGFLQSDEHDNPPQNPTTRTEPRKTWVVQQGDTVHHIATSEYGHPAHWRHIADSNNLHNPLALRPGQVLVLPPLP